jgi:hypothetical protein
MLASFATVAQTDAKYNAECRTQCFLQIVSDKFYTVNVHTYHRYVATPQGIKTRTNFITNLPPTEGSRTQMHSTSHVIIITASLTTCGKKNTKVCNMWLYVTFIRISLAL